MPEYIIIGGINGAGKSTLYLTYPEFFKGTYRINADEILQQQNGDWHSTKDNLTAMRMEIQQIKACLQNKISFHIETTLAGNGKSQEQYINLAHKKQYCVTLLYVGLSSSQLAIKRVKRRVNQGGHGIPDNVIERRYTQSFNNLVRIAKLVNNVFIFNNDNQLDLIYRRKNNDVLIDKLNNYNYFPDSNLLISKG